MSLAHYFFNDVPPPFDRFLDDAAISNRFRLGRQTDVFRPRMDIHNDDKTNTTAVIFDLPGMQKEDVTIDVHNSILTVSGETKETTERDEAGFAHRERHWGKWSRSVSLPQGTKNEDIKATMANGVLEITFPRSVPETAPSRIAIA